MNANIKLIRRSSGRMHTNMSRGSLFCGLFKLKGSYPEVCEVNLTGFGFQIHLLKAESQFQILSIYPGLY